MAKARKWTKAQKEEASKRAKARWRKIHAGKLPAPKHKKGAKKKAAKKKAAKKKPSKKTSAKKTSAKRQKPLGYVGITRKDYEAVKRVQRRFGPKALRKLIPKTKAKKKR